MSHRIGLELPRPLRPKAGNRIQTQTRGIGADEKNAVVAIQLQQQTLLRRFQLAHNDVEQRQFTHGETGSTEGRRQLGRLMGWSRIENVQTSAGHTVLWPLSSNSLRALQGLADSPRTQSVT